MLSFAVRRLSPKILVRTLQRDALSESKFSQRISCARYFSSTPTLKQADAAAAKVGVTEAAQIAPSASPPISDTVDSYATEESSTPLYGGDYLPHNTQIYTDYLAMEQTEKIVDISSASDVTISKIAEGLSTDLLTASGITPTLQDMGLGCWYTPAGLLQNVLDILHNAGLPWWVAIASTTLVLRVAVFPLIIDGQRHSIAMRNYMPEMQRLQLKMTEARRSGNALEASRAANAYATYIREKGMNPLKGMKPSLIQAPIFISFFIGLRGMANLPMESMKTGGIYWFTDLTVADPYCILPLVTCATVYIMLETGADGLMPVTGSKFLKYGLRAIPMVMFPIIMNFPGAMLCYWTTSNFFSLGQLLLLKRPAMRKRFNLPAAVTPEPTAPTQSKGFLKDMKESYTNAKLSCEINDRARVDEMRFRKSGTSPVMKTFKHPQQLKPTADN